MIHIRRQQHQQQKQPNTIINAAAATSTNDVDANISLETHIYSSFLLTITY